MGILLIEDDNVVREALKEALELFGYQVYDAPNGPQALAVLRERPEPVELVISDLVMPYMNSLELYEGLQELQPGVKMLIVTASPPSKPHTAAYPHSAAQKPSSRSPANTLAPKSIA